MLRTAWLHILLRRSEKIAARALRRAAKNLRDYAAAEAAKDKNVLALKARK